MDVVDRIDNAASAPLRALRGLAEHRGAGALESFRPSRAVRPVWAGIGGIAPTCQAYGLGQVATVADLDAMAVDATFSTRWGPSAGPPV